MGARLQNQEGASQIHEGELRFWISWGIQEDIKLLDNSFIELSILIKKAKSFSNRHGCDFILSELMILDRWIPFTRRGENHMRILLKVRVGWGSKKPFLMDKGRVCPSHVWICSLPPTLMDLSHTLTVKCSISPGEWMELPFSR